MTLSVYHRIDSGHLIVAVSSFVYQFNSFLCEKINYSNCKSAWRTIFITFSITNGWKKGTTILSYGHFSY